MIGEKIKTLRQKQKLSISELAERAGVAKSYLSSIERNIQSNPSIQFIEKVCQALNVSVDELMQGDSLEGMEKLDDEWLDILHEAINSGVSKEQFKEYIEFSKWRNEQED